MKEGSPSRSYVRKLRNIWSALQGELNVLLRPMGLTVLKGMTESSY